MARASTFAEIATFSIVTRCAETGRFGAAVASRAFAVGSRCFAARPRVGAVATQAWVDPGLRATILDSLENGLDAQGALDRALAALNGAEHCQVGVVDATGRSAAHTGTTTMPWSGHLTGSGYTVQGNLLAGATVLDAMALAFGNTTGPLAERLLAALDAGQAQGGDRRGEQSAALLVTDTANFPYVDLRVDDHAEPLLELRRLYRVRLDGLATYQRWVDAVLAGKRTDLA